MKKCQLIFWTGNVHIQCTMPRCDQTERDDCICSVSAWFIVLFFLLTELSLLVIFFEPKED